MIYGGDSSFNKRSQKLVWWEILKMEPAVQKPLRHSEAHKNKSHKHPLKWGLWAYGEGYNKPHL
jgi:hypothetical protein